MSVARWVLGLVMVIGLGTAARAAEVAIPPSPAHWATDTTGFLTAQTVATLDDRLRGYQSATGHQVLVYVTATTGSTPTEEWTVRAFARWKVGRKGLDDGLILFVFPTDRKVRIEVGYGLEQRIPDATAARIIRETITPKLKAGQPDAAVTGGVDAILAAIGGEASGNDDGALGKNGGAAGGGIPLPAPAAGPSPGRLGEIFGESIGILIGLLVVVVIIVIIIKLPEPKHTYISSSSSGSSFWGIAGDLLGDAVGGLASSAFSGGGGMSGGGGATGSW